MSAGLCFDCLCVYLPNSQTKRWCWIFRPPPLTVRNDYMHWHDRPLISMSQESAAALTPYPFLGELLPAAQNRLSAMWDRESFHHHTWLCLVVEGTMRGK